MKPGFVVVGGSYAAVQMAASARQAGYQGSITLVSNESAAPYQRPPLSKEYLLGQVEFDRLALRAPDFYREQGIYLRLGATAASVDADRQQLTLADGETVPYDWLGLATGARARRLNMPGADLEGVLTLRDATDADRLRDRLCAARCLVVVGGGFIGLEVAAAAVALGKSVTVVELEGRLLQRAVGRRMSDFLCLLHREAGVETRVLTEVLAFEQSTTQGRVSAVLCGRDIRLPADLVVVGAGALPNDELAAKAGIRTDRGILVDGHGLTSDERVVAAGDCTRFNTRYSSLPVRLESVQNATDQARSAGARVAGCKVPYDALPWFWSVQHGCRLQMAGLLGNFDCEIVRGSVEKKTFSVLYIRDGMLVAGESVNRPAEHMAIRRLIAGQMPLDIARAGDESTHLRDL